MRRVDYLQFIQNLEIFAILAPSIQKALLEADVEKFKFYTAMLEQAQKSMEKNKGEFFIKSQKVIKKLEMTTQKLCKEKRQNEEIFSIQSDKRGEDELLKQLSVL